MASIQQMPQYPKSKSKSWDWDGLELTDTPQKYHKVEQLNPVPTWSASRGNHDCKKFSVIEADVENHDPLNKTLKGRKLQFRHDWRQTNILLFPFPTHWQWDIRRQTWSCLICANSVPPKQQAMLDVSNSEPCPWPWPWHDVCNVSTSSSCGWWEPIHVVVLSHQTQDFPTET